MPDRTAIAGISVKRIRFTAQPASGQLIRRFAEPRQIAAIEAPEPSKLSQLPMDHSWPEPFDDLFVIVASTALPRDLQETVDLWLSPPDHPDAPRPVIFELESGTIRWRPGRAVLECTASSAENLLAALTGFSFFESELRRLEQDLLPYEASAQADTAVAYQIRSENRTSWPRLAQTMENLSRLRLTFARLSAALAIPPRSLDREGRRAAARLTARAGVPARLDAFSNRLEVCEDLYEGAVDRITDLQGWRKGEILEIIIIVLLVLEVILMAWQLAWHH
jgi:hypothetical protein